MLLYLLAAMHRDGELKLEMFEGAAGAKARDLIYSRTIDWVLTKQRPEWLNKDITAFQTESLRRILEEAGLCVVQSGGECAPVKMIEDRLKGDDAAKSLLEEARSRLNGDPLRNALAAFYLQPGRAGSGSVEFAHKSFGEYLCAGRIKESLADWAQPGIRRQEFYIPTEQMDWELYDLLGFGGLTPEIVEYITAYFDLCPEQFDAEKIVRLFNRLESFYVRWCDGEFIDAPPENLPQKKMRLLKEQLPDQEKPLGQRQVDVYTGLNVMILLLELHRHAQSKGNLRERIFFYPCGQIRKSGYEQRRLVQIISYGDSIKEGIFTTVVGSFLHNADLSHVVLSNNLSSANFSNTNLRRVYFINTGLVLTNFSSSDLTGADLRMADLRRANFQNANLASADLKGANLGNVFKNPKFSNFSGADLSGANLSEADFSGADLNGIIWDEQTNWEGVQGLETAVNLPDALKRQLGMEEVRSEE